MSERSQDGDDSKQAIRQILRKQAAKMRRVLLSSACHRTMENEIRGQIVVLQLLKREAKRKRQGKPLSKDFKKLCQLAVAGIPTAGLGPLSRLNSDQVLFFDQMLGALLDGLRGRAVIPGSMDPTAFLSFQKKMFVQPKKRGRKRSLDYDEAYRRHLRDESVSSIARDMDAYGFNADPEESMQKFRKAFRRRRLQSQADRT